MGLFDLFSNKDAEEAARQRNQGLQQGYDALSSTYGQGRDYLSSLYGQGRDATTAGFGNGNAAITSNYGQGRDAASAGYGQSSDAISNNYGQGRGAINAGAAAAQGYYQPLIQSTGAGATAYGNASGANGVLGLQQATSDFKNSGQYGLYGIGLGEGLQALERTHAAAGNLSSGNADTDAIRYAQDQASKSYGSYLNGLQSYLGANANAVGGAAGISTGQGGALNSSYQGEGNALGSNYIGRGNTLNASYQGEGNALSGNDVAQGGALNSSYQGQGAGLNNSLQGQGNAANANFTGQGASNAAATMNNYNVGANQLSALKDLGKGALNLFGMFN